MKQNATSRFAILGMAGLLLAGFAAQPARAEGGSGMYSNYSTYNRGGDASRENGSSGASDTYMETRVSDLENQIRTLNGRLEQADWQNKQLQSRLDKLQGDVEMRLNTLEHGGAAQAAVAPPASLMTPTVTPPAPRPRAAVNPADDDTINQLVRNREHAVEEDPNATETEAETAPPPVKPVNGKLGNLYMSGNRVTGADQQAVKPALPKPPQGYGLNAQEQYDQAFSLLRSADYDGAEAALKSFISKNPKDKLIDNAKYWLGETYYARNQYDAAAVAFADAYQTAPKGTKAPDSLLKLGLSLAGLKKKDDACTTLGEVTKRYPSASTAVKNRTDQEMKKLKCKS